MDLGYRLKSLMNGILFGIKSGIGIEIETAIDPDGDGWKSAT
jgi:hypothetical protein